MQQHERYSMNFRCIECNGCDLKVCPSKNKNVTATNSVKFYNVYLHWKQKIVNWTTLSSLVSPQVVITTTYGANSRAKSFNWRPFQCPYRSLFLCLCLTFAVSLSTSVPPPPPPPRTHTVCLPPSALLLLSLSFCLSLMHVCLVSPLSRSLLPIYSLFLSFSLSSLKHKRYHTKGTQSHLLSASDDAGHGREKAMDW